MTHASNPTEPRAPLEGVQQGELDESTFRSLIRDLGECTELVEVRVKSRDKAFSQAGQLAAAALPAYLDTVADGLWFGQVHAAQVTYHYLEQLWCDTLLCTGPERVTLVRVTLPS